MAAVNILADDALKPESKRSLFFSAAFLFMLALCVPMPLLNAQTISDKDIQKQLEAELKNATMAIRHFYSGSKLKYNSEGELISGGEPGSWTTNAYFEPEKINVSKKSVTISGKRLYWTYSDSENRPALIHAPKNIKIEIGRSPEQKDLPGILASIYKVFLKSDESLADFAPHYWRKTIQADFKTVAPAVFVPNTKQVRQETKYILNDKNIKEPQLQKYPLQPGYTEEARNARVAGWIALRAVINEDGNVKVTDILKPLGAGLDDNAVRTIEESWKFSPATRDGVPIVFPITIDVTFDLPGPPPIR
ncbi:MAG: TonB family protein [Acidobacteriota bacterium]|jgi:TonB family protein|nr:TonB family protein [Acidobacteriota bacterium]